MPAVMPRDCLGDGVIYARRDSPGLSGRFLIAVIDFLIVACVAFGLGIVFAFTMPTMQAAQTAMGLSSLAFVVVYSVVIEPTIGTLGYLAAGVKIVDLKGRRPSYFRMFCRLTLWFFGPFHPLLSFCWIANDRRKQTLPDKVCGTYLVKKRAVPMARGRMRAEHYFLVGFSILFWEVEKSAPFTPASDPSLAQAVMPIP